MWNRKPFQKLKLIEIKVRFVVTKDKRWAEVELEEDGHKGTNFQLEVLGM